MTTIDNIDLYLDMVKDRPLQPSSTLYKSIFDQLHQEGLVLLTAEGFLLTTNGLHKLVELQHSQPTNPITPPAPVLTIEDTNASLLAPYMMFACKKCGVEHISLDLDKHKQFVIPSTITTAKGKDGAWFFVCVGKCE